jgi:hypothetical protein
LRRPHRTAGPGTSATPASHWQPTQRTRMVTGSVLVPSGHRRRRGNQPGDTRTFTETLTRSQSGRVTRSVATDSAAPANTIDWSYSYDTTARLTGAVLGAAGTRPGLTLGYGYSPTGGCGPDPAAGANAPGSRRPPTWGPARSRPAPGAPTAPPGSPRSPGTNGDIPGEGQDRRLRYPASATARAVGDRHSPIETRCRSRPCRPSACQRLTAADDAAEPATFALTNTRCWLGAPTHIGRVVRSTCDKKI